MTQYDRPMTLRRALAAAVLALVGLAGLLGASVPWSPSGWAVLAVSALAAGATYARTARSRHALRGLAGVAIVALLLLRLTATRTGRLQLLVLPGATSSRWLGRLIDEQDVSLLGARLLAAGALGRGWLVPAERQALARELHDAYVEMRADLGLTPSPALDTLAGRQGPGSFDTLVLEPAHESPGAAVVFLHGYTGSFTLECWLVAGSAAAIGAVTVCPATGFAGHWSGPDGERTLGATLAFLHGRGVRRVYLAGLSNGAVGAAAHAPRFSATPLAGLILIAGAPGGAVTGLPTLVVHGDHDPVAPARAARAHATAAHGTYVGLDGGHFALLTSRARARDEIASWLRARESAATGSLPPR